MPENLEIEETARSLGHTMCSYLFTFKYYLSLKENSDKSFPSVSDNGKKVEAKGINTVELNSMKGLSPSSDNLSFVKFPLHF